MNARRSGADASFSVLYGRLIIKLKGRKEELIMALARFLTPPRRKGLANGRAVAKGVPMVAQDFCHDPAPRDSGRCKWPRVSK